MHQASALAAYAAHWLDPAAVRSFRARFLNVYWPGDAMTYDITVARKYRDDETGHCMVDLELACSRPSGDRLVEAWMTLNLGNVAEG